MFSRARRSTRKRRFLTALALGFATLVAAGSASAAVARPYEPSYEPAVNSGMSPSLLEQHLLREQRDAELAGFQPQTRERSAANASGGLDREDWMRGVVLAAALIAASAFALITVRGVARAAHS
jgi:hypothetical protein